jgi:ABC-2 type transport system permease protein
MTLQTSRTSIGRAMQMAAFETQLLFCQRTTVLSNSIGSMVVLAFPLLAHPTTRTQWAAVEAPSVVFVVLFTIYVTTAGSIAARRDMQVLKRLRTSQLRTGEMLFALIAPLVLVGVLQLTVVLVGYRLMGAPAPSDLVLMLGAVTASALLAAFSGLATGMVARDAERVQFAVLPLILIGAVAANLVLVDADASVRAWIPLMPFAGVADLAARALGVSDVLLAPDVFPLHGSARDILVTMAWVALSGAVARRAWRWEPRR